MKKTVQPFCFILISFLLLLFNSCEKEDVQINLPLEEITYNEIVSLEDRLSRDPIVATNSTGNVINIYDIILYKTNSGNYGKLKVLDIDYSANKNLLIEAVTYNNDGSVLSQAENLTIRGTWFCDLNAMEESGPSFDFHWRRVNIDSTLLSPIGDAIFAKY